MKYSYAYPRVVAHRGCGKLAEANTLAAVKKAASLGIGGIEVDAHVTLDGIPVLHHDSCLPDGRCISRTQAAELPYSVPRLIDVVRYCTIMRTWLDVDVKMERAKSEPELAFHLRCRQAGRIVAHILKSERLPHWSCVPRMMLSSFSSSVLAGAVEIAGDDIVMARITKDVSQVDESETLVIPATTDTDQIDALSLEHMIWVWGSPTKDEADALFRAGVIGIITDSPEIL